MPTYEYKCPEGHVTEKVTRVADYEPYIACGSCGNFADRFISRAPASFVKADISYRCPITDKPITSRREHEENLARHGCRILETGEREDVDRKRAAEDAAFEAKIEQTAVEFVTALPTEKREQLGREIESGLDVSVERH